MLIWEANLNKNQSGKLMGTDLNRELRKVSGKNLREI